MANAYTPSMNIVRDAARSFKYIPTPNVQRLAREIFLASERGSRCFSLIGSYGTGKSSFLVALDQSLRGNNLLEVDVPEFSSYTPLRLVGGYTSFKGALAEILGCSDHDAVPVLAKLKEAAKGKTLWLYTDEFGKYLEYAAKNMPEEELYFIQQLAEFVNDPANRCVWLLTLHQNFEAYGVSSANTALRDEWKKVRGRLHELGFNEPVEQLLYLASQHLSGTSKYTNREGLAYDNGLVQLDPESIGSFSGIAPLDLVSGGVLAKSLQIYGQNERSLFSFLHGTQLEAHAWFRVDNVYDYLLDAFYGDIHSPYNPFYRQWQAIQEAVERTAIIRKQGKLCSQLVKTVGLLQLFAKKTAQIDKPFLQAYFKGLASADDIEKALRSLVNAGLILFARYARSYHISQGTDVDFDQAIARALEEVEEVVDLAGQVRGHFKFEVIVAKRATYNKGTPRLFEYVITDSALEAYAGSGPLDGAINLVFPDGANKFELPEHHDVPVVYAVYADSNLVASSLKNIKAAQLCLVKHQDDPVARTEFKRILEGFELDLKRQVAGAFYDKSRVTWYAFGHKQPVESERDLNRLLSEVCKVVYHATPTLRNELFNKHKISTSIHTARKNYFDAIVNRSALPGFGFEGDRIPAERAILATLVMRNGMHHEAKGGAWELGQPIADFGLLEVWKQCEVVLKQAVEEQVSITAFWLALSSPPFKLKQGFLDFWIPTFLFAKRASFALYQEGRFVPELNEATLYLMTRTPQVFQIKAFEISGVKLQVFNRYREILHLSDADAVTNAGFVESIRPFLVFYRTLNDYARQTKRVSTEAQRIRTSIEKARDPERLFFEEIPAALGIEVAKLATDEALTATFATSLNDCIRELRTAFDGLLERWEAFIAKQLLGVEPEFEVYKSMLASAYKQIDPVLLSQQQRILVDRFQSPIEDRDSWLASIAQAVLGKPLDRSTDDDESRLFEGFKNRVAELNNLVELHALKVPKGAVAYKLEVSNLTDTKATKVIVLPDDQQEVESQVTQLQEVLRSHPRLKEAILARLIDEELKSP